MRITTLTTITIAIFLLSWCACKKDTAIPVSKEDVTITINSPKENTTYKPGDTIHIQASVKAQQQLHGYIVRIYYGDSVLFDTEGHSHSNQLNIDEKWVNNVNLAAELQLEISTVIDHNGNTKKVKKAFNSQP